MLYVEPTGTLIWLLRQSSDLVAITTDEGITGMREAKVAPNVTVERASISETPYGPGSARIDVRSGIYYIKCRAERKRDGDIQALRMADIVVAFLNSRRPFTRTVGGDKIGIHRVFASIVGPVLWDPDEQTGDPYAVVTATLDAGAHALP